MNNGTRRPTQVQKMARARVDPPPPDQPEPTPQQDAVAVLLAAADSARQGAEEARSVLAQRLARCGRTAYGVPATDLDAVLTAEGYYTFFRRLQMLGFNADTPWQQLAVWLPQLSEEARVSSRPPLGEAGMANLVLVASALRRAVGAQAFCAAAGPAMALIQQDNT